MSRRLAIRRLMNAREHIAKRKAALAYADNYDDELWHSLLAAQQILDKALYALIRGY